MEKHSGIEMTVDLKGDLFLASRAGEVHDFARRGLPGRSVASLKSHHIVLMGCPTQAVKCNRL